MSLKFEVEEKLVTNCDDFEISKLIKKEIRSYINSLEEKFKETQGKQFLYRHTKEIDTIISLIYKTVLRIFFKDYIPMSNQLPITLVALGSYGREQLSIYSDIDLMIVYKSVDGYNIKNIVEKIFYIAWDSGLKLGHRAHEIEEIIPSAKEDITIKTAMLESRFICGSKLLYIELESKLNRLRNDQKSWYIEFKLKEHNDRILKYPFSMEPNIKDGCGGIRDANTLYWIANVIYKIKSLRDLSEILYSDNEYKEFRVHLEFLFRLRSALHISSLKKQDRLVLELLPQVSLKLGFENSYKGQIECAKKALESIFKIHVFSEIFIKKLTRPFLYDSKNIKILKNCRIDKGLYLIDNKLYSSYHKSEFNIYELLKFLLSLEDTSIDFDVSFIYLVKRTKTNKTLNNINLKSFKKIFYRINCYNIIKLFYNAGLLDIFIPQFKKIAYLPQFDGYHSLPVDLHTIETIYHLENIKNSFINDLYNNIDLEKKILLKFVLIFHDIGKGRKRDHSLIGEQLFKNFSKKIDLNYQDIGEILIREHTLMTTVVQREDIYSERVLLNFVAKIKTKEILDLLLILTYADVNSVSSGRFTKFLEKLLFELYNNALVIFSNEKLLNQTQKRTRRENSLSIQKEFLELPKDIQKNILLIKSNQFFLMLKNREIIELAKTILNCDRYGYRIDNEHFLIIEIVREIPLNLGYLLGKLKNYNIVSMDIFKLFNNKKYFRITFDEICDEQDLFLLQDLIKSSFDMKKEINIEKPIILKRDIKIDSEYSKDLVEVTLSAKDQKGLLAYVGKIFDYYGIEIFSAKIHTYNSRVRDTFLIEKNNDFYNNWDRVIGTLTS